MRVILIAHTTVFDHIPDYVPHTDPVTSIDELGEQAGRLCYLSFNRPNPATATNEGYLDNIHYQAHFSVEEHGSATFYIDGVTRAFLLELERHRHFSYSVVSQRYVPGTEFDFVEHPALAKLSDKTKARLSEHWRSSIDLYNDIVDELENLGDVRKTARGAARTVLPEGTETRLMVSGNMRAWKEMLWKRLSPSADLEIRKVARLLLDELKVIAPNTFKDLDF